MPATLLKPCSHPSCPELTEGGPCPAHAKQRDQRRGSAHQRGFTYRWSLFSKRWLAKYPLCGMRMDGQLHAEHSKCVQQNIVTSAQCTDHIDGHSRADDLATFYEPARLQSLCANCNRIKAIEHEGGFGR